MVGIVMAVWVRVAGSVRVLVFVLVEYDLQAPAERISDAAQRLQAWNMIAAFEARDHGFCHPKSLRQLLLSLACMSAKLEQAVSALGGDCDAVIRQALSPSGRAGCALAGSAKVSDARFRRLSIDRFWRKAAVPNIGCVRCERATRSQGSQAPDRPYRLHPQQLFPSETSPPGI